MSNLIRDHRKGYNNQKKSIMVRTTLIALNLIFISSIFSQKPADYLIPTGFAALSFVAANAEKKEVAKEIPNDRLLIETDCPFLTPHPFRGKRNEPSYVKYVAEQLAELKGLTYEEIASITTENAKRLFRIN